MASATRGTVPSGVRIRADAISASRVVVGAGAGTGTQFAGGRAAADFSLHLGDEAGAYLGGSAKTAALDIVPSGLATGSALRTSYESADYALGNWQTRTLAPGVWRAFAYLPEFARYVGVGDNAIQVSSDGVTWETRTSPADRRWHKLAYAAGIRVLVAGAADSGATPIISSTDGGLTWTARAAGSDPIGAIAYGGGQFVALSSGGADLYTSPDGATWTAHTRLRRLWSGIAWAEELGRFAAVSVDGGNGGQAATSEDGIVWTTRATPTQGGVNAGWRAVAWSGPRERFVAVAASGPAGRVMWSSDGLSWETVSTPEQGAWSDVAWAAELGQFVVSARAGGDRRVRGARTLTSPDGQVWTARVVYTEEGQALHAVAGTGEMIMAAERETGRYLTEITPSWVRTSSGFSGTWYGIAWAPEIGTLVAVGTNVIGRSTNGGTTWAVTSLIGAWTDVVWAPEIRTFVAVADQGSSAADSLAYSKDGGVTWTNVTTGSDRRWWAVTWAPDTGTFVAVAISGHYARSTNGGVSWEVTARSGLWWGVTYAPELRTFVKVNFSGGTSSISYSTDNAASWANATVTTAELYAVAWAPELSRFVAVGVDAVRISTDGGLNWSDGTIPSGSWRGVLWAPELRAFVAVGGSSLAAFSTTGGASWETLNRPTGTAWAAAWLREYGRIVVPDQSSGYSTQQYERRITRFPETVPAFQSLAHPGYFNSGLAWDPSSRTLVVVLNNYAVALYSPSPGAPWITAALGTNGRPWRTVAYSPVDNVFVAGAEGTTEQIGRSTDSGRSWSTQTQGAAQKIIWANTPTQSRFVSVGNGIRYSTTAGDTWVLASNTTSIRDVAYVPETNVFVAVRDGNVSRSTGSAENWTNQALTGNHLCITYASRLRRLLVMGVYAAVRYSDDDGVTWTSVASTPLGSPASGWYSVDYSPELNLFAAFGASDRVAYSTTGGLSWFTAVQSNGLYQGNNQLRWIRELNSFVSAAGSTAVLFQTYAINAPAYALTARADPALKRFEPLSASSPPQWLRQTVSGTWYGIAWAPEINTLVAVGSASNLARSTNGGTSWTVTSLSGSWTSVVWAPEIQTFVAVADEGTFFADRLAYSTDGGVSWTNVTTGSGRRWYGVTWAADTGTFVAVAISGHFARSTDGGVSWEVTARTGNWYGVTYAPELQTFVAVNAANGTSRISYSTDNAVSWADATVTTAQLYGVAWSPELSRFVAVGSSAVRISTDGGVNWSNGTIPTGNWFGILWASELRAFVAVGTSSSTAFSTTGGDTWETLNRPSGTSWNAAWLREYGRLIAPDTSNGISRAQIPSISAPSQLAITAGGTNVLTVTNAGIAVRGTISSFTGCHRVFWAEPLVSPSPALNGLVVCTTGDMAAVSLDDSVPHVRLASAARDPAVFGVVHVGDSGALLVNGLGEGALWVCDQAGAQLANGDYVCASDLAGYAMRQGEDWVEAFTVAKVLFDVDFAADPEAVEARPVPKAEFPPEPEAPAPEEGAADAGEATEPAAEGTAGEATEPAAEGTAGEATEPAAEGTASEAIEPAAEPTPEATEPAPEAIEPTSEATEPTTESAAEPTPEASGLPGEMAAEEEEPIEEITTEGAVATLAAEQEARSRQVNYMCRSAGGVPYEVRHLLRREDGTAEVLLREAWLEKRAAGEAVFMAAFVGCTYHCG